MKEVRIGEPSTGDMRILRDRSLREARATARIDHPNVVRVYDVAEGSDGLWIVMELVEARSLERVLAEDGPLSARKAALVGFHLAGALRAVHAMGVLHRDLKPENVLIVSGERVILSGFGIAAIQDETALTMTGMIVGSPDYMPPERISGHRQGPPSDLWSLGATLCAAVAGQSPFTRQTTLATLHAVLYEEPVLPAAGLLTQLLAALLAKNPDARPTIDEVAAALQRFAFSSAPHTAQALESGDAPEPECANTAPRPDPAGGGADAPPDVVHDSSNGPGSDWFSPRKTGREAVRPYVRSNDRASPSWGGGVSVGGSSEGAEPPGSHTGQRDAFPQRRLVAELVEQTSPGREVSLQVQVICGGETGVPLRGFAISAQGARLLITVHAPGLLMLGDPQQEMRVEANCDSDVLRFGLRTLRPGLHTVTVRAFREGSFLGELRVQISVEEGVPARDGPPRVAALESLAMDPGEATLQVLKEADGTYRFQLISATSYAPESFRLLAGDPGRATENIYRELRATAAAAGAGTSAARVRERLRNLGVSLWGDAVPDAVRRQFWQEADRIRAFTVVGEHDVVPWELLYPVDGIQEGDGFLAEWLPVVRRVFGQDRVRQLALPRATFVVPPASPPEADQEVTALRARFGPAVAYGGTLTGRAEVQDLVNAGMAGLLHFACHNVFTGAGSRVTMADGSFDPLDLAYASRSGALRATRPLVFFNACRSAGQIDWYSTTMGWAPQFLKAGAGAFVGTLWPVRSDSALTYADAFYTHLVTDRLPLGEASMKARQAIRDLSGDPTWLAYAVYGSPAACCTPS